MRPLLGVFCVAGAFIVTACADATPVRAQNARRVVRLVRTVETSMSERLAREYSHTMPHLDIEMVDGGGPGGTVSAIQKGAADLGFILADVAYFANLDAQKLHDSAAELRGMAALQTAPVHVLARGDVDLSRIAQQRPLRIGVNSAFSSQFRLANLVLGAYGLKDGGQPIQLAAAEIADALHHGVVDVAFVTAYYPAQSVAGAANLGIPGGRCFPLAFGI